MKRLTSDNKSSKKGSPVKVPNINLSESAFGGLTETRVYGFHQMKK